MKIIIKYNRISKTIELPDDATVDNLKNEISKTFNFSPESQKILHKGKQLNENDKHLSEFGIKNGTKLLLLASEEPKTENPVTQPQPQPASGIQALFNPIHPPTTDKEIIALGVPKGAIQNFQAVCSSLPKDPFIVRTNKGVAKFQIETDALFIEYLDVEGSDRILPYDIQAYSIEQPVKGDYFHLCMRTTKGAFIIYFLPNQYKNIISSVIASLGR